MNNYQNIQNKVMEVSELARLVAAWKLTGNKIVFTNGCFDLLHKGHIAYLCETANKGDKLIVAVNSDQSIKKLNKGDGRPIQDQQSRAEIIAALKMVDAVVIFNEDTPEELIIKLNPDVLVKGGDWKVEQIAGASHVLKNGGKVETVAYIDGYSTTSIEKRIKNG